MSQKKLFLSFKHARIQDFGGGPKSLYHVRCIPTKKTEVPESTIKQLFKPAEQGGDPMIEHYRSTGELLIQNQDGTVWAPDGAQVAPLGFDVESTSIAPQSISKPDDRPVADDASLNETAEAIEPVKAPGGGVPGQGVRDGRKEISKCNDLETLKAWREREERSSLQEQLDKKIAKLEAGEAAEAEEPKEE